MALPVILEIPNLLSLSRVVVAPVIGYFLWKGDGQSTLICVVLLVLAGITDGLDGYLARRMRKVSRLGIALDPIADKVFAGILVVMLILFRDFPIWLAVVIIGRDFLILGIGVSLVRKYDLNLPSNLIGKYAFCSIVALLGSYVIRFDFGIIFYTWFTIGLVVASFVSYGVVFFKVRRSHNQPQPFSERPVFRTVRIAASLGLLFFTIYKLYLFVCA